MATLRLPERDDESSSRGLLFFMMRAVVGHKQVHVDLSR